MFVGNQTFTETVAVMFRLRLRLHRDRFVSKSFDRWRQNNRTQAPSEIVWWLNGQAQTFCQIKMSDRLSHTTLGDI